MPAVHVTAALAVMSNNSIDRPAEPVDYRALAAMRG